MAHNRFVKGSGCFRCSVCKKLTRLVGQSNESLCRPCEDFAMWENGVADGNITLAEFRAKFPGQGEPWSAYLASDYVAPVAVIDADEARRLIEALASE